MRHMPRGMCVQVRGGFVWGVLYGVCVSGFAWVVLWWWFYVEVVR